MKAYPEYKESEYDWIGDIPDHWKMVQLKFVAPRKTEQTEDVKGFGFQIALENIESKTGKIIGGGSFEGLGNIFRKDDVLFNKLRPYLCKVVIAPNDGVAVSELLVLRPREDIENRFLFYRLLESKFISVVDGSTYGAKMPRANWDFIGNLKIPVPSLPEQQAIADFLDRKTAQIDTLIAKKQRQIELLQEQRTALINHAVTKGLNPNAKMKDSGVEWLGEIPSHWIVSKLKYVCYVSDGNHGEEYPEENDFTDEANGVPFIRVTEFEGFNITRNGILYITKEKNESMRKGGLQENDILFVNRGSIGKMALVSKEFEGANLNSQIAYFRVTSPKMNYKYLLYFLCSGTFQKMISSLIHGGALQQLPLKRIIGLEVLCPPLEDQIEIVNYLEKITTKADLSIKSISKEIELVQEYRTALISEAVTGKIDVRTAE